MREQASSKHAELARGDMHNNYNLRRVECEIGHANKGRRLPRICALCWLLQSVHRALKTAVRL